MTAKKVHWPEVKGLKLATAVKLPVEVHLLQELGPNEVIRFCSNM
jgi:hypothetical protein